MAEHGNKGRGSDYLEALDWKAGWVDLGNDEKISTMGNLLRCRLPAFVDMAIVSGEGLPKISHPYCRGCKSNLSLARRTGHIACHGRGSGSTSLALMSVTLVVIYRGVCIQGEGLEAHIVHWYGYAMLITGGMGGLPNCTSA
jgi:hypothetical protein